ncbi:hypothetical protein CYG68_06465 [Morganella morganii]|uniref:Uncharacterized protein n=1 Tax=Morganella morganii TaxID=582 RepID=A0A8I0PT84_MORMO|nr:hypothetical protein [Morganella morganii]MBE8612061.1 hypothetical protein [Morganella morganii]
MENNNILSNRRKSFTDAFFHHLKKKGKAASFRRTVNGVQHEIDLDAGVLTQALISLYENKICKDAGYTEQQIINSYANYYSENGNITPDGEMFISLITKSIAENMHKKETKE